MISSSRGGRPIKAPAWSLEATLEFLHEALDKQPANVPVSVGRSALVWLERMQEQHRQERAEVYKAHHTEELYAALVTDHNAIWHAAEAFGVEVFQPMESEAWHWTRGDARGSAPTPAQALIEALASD